MTTAADMRDAYLAAELDILTHGVSNHFAGHILTMADLPSIRAGRAEWEARAIAEARANATTTAGLSTRVATFRD